VAKQNRSRRTPTCNNLGLREKLRCVMPVGDYSASYRDPSTSLARSQSERANSAQDDRREMTAEEN